jgi:hypothetical protein
LRLLALLAMGPHAKTAAPLGYIRAATSHRTVFSPGTLAAKLLRSHETLAAAITNPSRRRLAVVENNPRSLEKR